MIAGRVRRPRRQRAAPGAGGSTTRSGPVLGPACGQTYQQSNVNFTAAPAPRELSAEDWLSANTDIRYWDAGRAEGYAEYRLTALTSRLEAAEKQIEVLRHNARLK